MGTAGTSSPHIYSDLPVARTLVNLDGKQIPLRVMNLSTLPQKINKGAELAHCETLPANCTIETDATDDLRVVGAVQNLGGEAKLPHHFTDLYNRSTKNLTRSESSEVFKLLCEFADIFHRSQRSRLHGLSPASHQHRECCPHSTAAQTTPSGKEGRG